MPTLAQLVYNWELMHELGACGWDAEASKLCCHDTLTQLYNAPATWSGPIHLVKLLFFDFLPSSLLTLSIYCLDQMQLQFKDLITQGIVSALLTVHHWAVCKQGLKRWIISIAELICVKCNLKSHIQGGLSSLHLLITAPTSGCILIVMTSYNFSSFFPF